ncbi:MAG: hypothetical protein ACI8XB_001740 [Patiriisocius sp.]|jgi:hypothetical protein
MEIPFLLSSNLECHCIHEQLPSLAGQFSGNNTSPDIRSGDQATDVREGQDDLLVSNIKQAFKIVIVPLRFLQSYSLINFSLTKVPPMSTCKK